MARVPSVAAPARAPRRAVAVAPMSGGGIGRTILAGVGGILAALARLVARRPVPVVIGLVLATGAVCVGWNVLMLQTRKHPAPLFAGRPDASRAEPARRAVSPSAPAATPAAVPASGIGIPAGGPPANAAPAPLAELPPPARRTQVAADVPTRTGSTRTAGDPIGVLIRTGQPPRAEQAAADLPHGADPRRIAAAQAALTKLGYGPLKSDGLLGPGTRAALERFERDRKLPGGEILPARTARVLAQASGIRVE